jgi:hypothetical protein
MRAALVLLKSPIVVAILFFFVTIIVGRWIEGPAVCADGWPSQSIGRQGACSHHGGVGGSWSATLAFFGAILIAASGYVRGWWRAQPAEPPVAALVTKNGHVYLPKAAGVPSDPQLSFDLGEARPAAPPRCPRCGEEMRLHRPFKHPPHDRELIWLCDRVGCWGMVKAAVPREPPFRP